MSKVLINAPSQPLRNRYIEGKTIRKKVNCYSLDGTFLSSHESGSAAAKELNIHQSSISECCLGKRRGSVSKGYIFRFAEDDDSIVPMPLNVAEIFEPRVDTVTAPKPTKPKQARDNIELSKPTRVYQRWADSDYSDYNSDDGTGTRSVDYVVRLIEENNTNTEARLEELKRKREEAVDSCLAFYRENIKKEVEFENEDDYVVQFAPVHRKTAATIAHASGEQEVQLVYRLLQKRMRASGQCFKGKRIRRLDTEHRAHGVDPPERVEDDELCSSVPAGNDVAPFSNDSCNKPVNTADGRSVGVTVVEKDGIIAKLHKEVICMSKSGEVLGTFKGGAEAAKAFGLSHSLISKCCTGKVHSAGGYKFAFA
jgi:hypothetical protein